MVPTTRRVDSPEVGNVVASQCAEKTVTNVFFDVAKARRTQSYVHRRQGCQVDAVDDTGDTGAAVEGTDEAAAAVEGEGIEAGTADILPWPSVSSVDGFLTKTVIPPASRGSLKPRSLF